MKVLHINTSSSGGAAKACIRLHEGLLKQGIDSKVLVLLGDTKNNNGIYQFTKTQNFTDKLKSKIERILTEVHLHPFKDKFGKRKILNSRPKGSELFSFPDSAFDITQHPLYLEADIINLHWVAEFVDYKSFFKDNKKNIVWTLHDLNPFTGGCHYPGDCKGYETNCTNCPLITSSPNPNASKEILETKIKALDSNVKLSPVFLSNWLFAKAEKSPWFSKFKFWKIPNGIDETIFRTLDRKYSRELLGLPLDKKVILFVADSLIDKRKGYALLLEAIDQLENKEEFVLCSVGSINRNQQKNLNVVELGKIEDERLMASIYSAADVFVIPSLEDNLPNTVLESLMCGTPVIGFPIGGVLDMVENNKNGFLCENVGSTYLANSIKKFLNNSNLFNREEIRNDTIKKYGSQTQAKAYIELYHKILEQ